MSEDPQALGQRLKAERERRGMSAQKIANGMHLDEWVIDALEAGDYQRIGPAVYARGHLKKYASLLGVSPELPAADSKPQAPPTGTLYPPPIVRLEAPGSHAAGPAIGAVAAIAILAGGAYWWHQGHPRTGAPAVEQTPEPVAPASAAPQEPSDAATAQPALEAEAQPPGGAPRDTEAAPSPDGGGASPPAAPAAPAPPGAAPAPTARALVPARPVPEPGPAGLTPGVGKAKLRMSFSADSWVEIEDYSGQRLYAGNGRANSVKTVAGMAPFRVFLRSASGVQLELNDRAVAIGRQYMHGDEARFEAGADGVLRRDPRTATKGGAQTAVASPQS